MLKEIIHKRVTSSFTPHKISEGGFKNQTTSQLLHAGASQVQLRPRSSRSNEGYIAVLAIGKITFNWGLSSKC